MAMTHEEELIRFAATMNVSSEISNTPCKCWDFDDGDGDEWPHFKDADGRCTPISRALQQIG